MNKSDVQKCLCIFLLWINCFNERIEMEPLAIQIPGIIIPYKKYITSMFPVPIPNSIVIISSKVPDEETLRIASIKGDKIKEDKVPLSEFEPVNETGEMASGSPYLFLFSTRIHSIVDIENKKEIVSYWGVGNVLINTYIKCKVIDYDKMLVLSAFEPLYDSTYSKPVNYTPVLTIEDFMNKKRIKQIPINTLSGDYITATMGDLSPTPDVFFGDDFTVYREDESYDWLCVDNNLEPIDHPLPQLLNANKHLFQERLVSMAINQKSNYAVIMYGFGNLAILAWDRDPAIIPIVVGKDMTPSTSYFTMSPSGKWVFFQTEEKSKNYVIPIDPELPSFYLPPIPLDYTGFIEKITWMSDPEGLIIYNKFLLHYWDLSKIDPGTFGAPELKGEADHSD